MGGPYTCTDGTVFEKKSDWRKHEMLTQYTFQGKEGETLPFKKPGDVNGQAFDIYDLVDCTAAVCDATDQVQVDNCSGCKVMVGAAGESVFIRNCKDCTFFVACKQLRLRDCENVTLSLYSQTEPVIELSAGIAFSPFSGGFAGQAECMRDANLDPAVNFWWGIYDFNDEQKTGKNFTVSATPLEPWWPLGAADQVCAQTAPESAPLPSTQGDGAGGGLGHGGPTQPPAAGGGGASFDIRTGQAEAQKVLDKNKAEADAASVTLLDDDSAVDPAWVAHRVGVRYDPPLLALEFADGAGTIMRKDIPFPEADELAEIVAEVDDDLCASAILDHLADTANNRAFLDFDRLFSKRQVLRLIDTVLQGGPEDF